MPNIKKTKLTDAQHESIEQRLNRAIHELVFAIKHAEDDELTEASECIMTAQSTIDEVAAEIVGNGLDQARAAQRVDPATN
jgi:hypothetical protein